MGKILPGYSIPHRAAQRIGHLDSLLTGQEANLI